MLNKYYNKSQKHVENVRKVLKISEIFHSSSTHVLSLIFLPRELVCQFLPFMFVKKFRAVN